MSSLLRLYDTSGRSLHMNVLLWGSGDFQVNYPNRDTSWNSCNRHSGSFMVNTGPYSAIWSLPLMNVKCNYDPRSVTVTSPIKLPIHRSWFSPKYEWFPRSICNGVSCKQETRTFLDQSLFRTRLCSHCWDQISQTCHVFSLLFILNPPRYFPDFANNF